MKPSLLVQIQAIRAKLADGLDVTEDLDALEENARSVWMLTPSYPQGGGSIICNADRWSNLTVINEGREITRNVLPITASPKE